MFLKFYCLGNFPFFIQQKCKHVGEHGLKAMVEWMSSDHRGHTMALVYLTAIKTQITMQLVSLFYKILLL